MREESICGIQKPRMLDFECVQDVSLYSTLVRQVSLKNSGKKHAHSNSSSRSCVCCHPVYFQVESGKFECRRLWRVPWGKTKTNHFILIYGIYVWKAINSLDQRAHNSQGKHSAYNMPQSEKLNSYRVSFISFSLEYLMIYEGCPKTKLF